MKVYLFIKQMRLQSHFDGPPVCLIRYRLTQKAADLVRLVFRDQGSLMKSFVVKFGYFV